MPIDPRLWLDAPPKSSYPACLAVLAAAEQGLSDAYLRRAREALAYERRRLDHGDALIELAREIATMNVERFASDLASHAILEAFGADLERTRAAGDAALPRVEFQEGDATVGELRGGSVTDPEAWSAAAAAAGARRQSATAPSVEQALRAYGRLATPEVAAACGLPGPRAQAELWWLAGEWRVRAERHLSGETWTLA
jgi:hypothetical protein